MRDFMDYVSHAFDQATGWKRVNSYTRLNSTSDALLKFETPEGLSLALSSLATSHFATSYQLGSVDVVDGTISYLYSSVPLHTHLTPKSDAISLQEYLRAYRPLADLRRPDSTSYPLFSPANPSLLFGRFYLPGRTLEALAIKRLSPLLQCQVAAVSSSLLKNGGVLVGTAEYDVGKYAVEGLTNSDGGVLGIRGVYNFGGDAENLTPSQSRPAGRANGKSIEERIYGRFTTGGELYYGIFNKVVGVSVAGRFATLPEHRGTPLTATLTVNPIMGHITATYAVVAGKHCSLATRMDFNVYSYDSAWVVGMELWRKNFLRHDLDQALSAEKFVKKERSFQAKLDWKLDDPAPEKPRPVPVKDEKRKEGPRERSFQAKMEWRLDDPAVDEKKTQTKTETKAKTGAVDEEYSSVIKARIDDQMRIGVLWEGRVKSLLFSLGSAIDLRKLDSPFRTLGVEIQFSS